MPGISFAVFVDIECSENVSTDFLAKTGTTLHCNIGDVME